MKNLICALALIVSLSYGCAMPTTTVRTVDDRPAIAIKGAPSGAMLFVDGFHMGLANRYAVDSANSENPTALTVEPGTHVIRVTLDGATIFEQKVFVESSLKTIIVR
jgi:hypothetical protein